MHKVTQVTPLEGYRLRVQFADTLTGEVDLSNRLFGPMFKPLKDWNLFAQVHVDSFGAICWPNGADLAPDALYQAIASQRVSTP